MLNGRGLVGIGAEHWSTFEAYKHMLLRGEEVVVGGGLWLLLQEEPYYLGLYGSF